MPDASDDPLSADAPAPARFVRDLAAIVGDRAVRHGRFGIAVSGGPDSLALLLVAHAALGNRIAAACAPKPKTRRAMSPKSAPRAASRTPSSSPIARSTAISSRPRARCAIGCSIPGGSTMASISC